MPTGDWLRRLAADRDRLDRGSTAQRVADVLRDHITEGTFPPGTRLNEETLRSALGVSRNTLREAFRLLAHDGLLTHELNRGVFVRTLSVADIRDLYLMRRMLEGAAIRVPVALDQVLPQAGSAVVAAEEAAARGHWSDVAAADVAFHQALADLAGSPRVSEATRRLLAESQLAFQMVSDQMVSDRRRLHEPCVAANRDLHRLLSAGRIAEAATVLEETLTGAERRLLAAYPSSLTKSSAQAH